MGWLTHGLLTDSGSFMDQKRCNVFPTSVTVKHWQLRDLVRVSSKYPHQVVYACNKTVGMLDTTTGTIDCLAELDFEPRCISAVSDYVATGGVYLGQLSLTVRGGSETKTYEHEIGGYINNSVNLFNPVGSSVNALICNNDHNLSILDIHEGSFSLKQAVRHPIPLNHASISPDFKTIISCGDSEDVFVLHPEEKSSKSLKPMPDGWQLQDKPLSNPSGGHGFSTGFSANGLCFAVASQQGILSIWDSRYVSNRKATPLAVIKSSRMNSSGAFRCVKFSDTVNDLLAVSEHYGRVHVVDLRRLDERQMLKIPPAHSVLQNSTYSEACTPVNGELEFEESTNESLQNRHGVSAATSNRLISRLREITGASQAAQVADFLLNSNYNSTTGILGDTDPASVGAPRDWDPQVDIAAGLIQQELRLQADAGVASSEPDNVRRPSFGRVMGRTSACPPGSLTSESDRNALRIAILERARLDSPTAENHLSASIDRELSSSMRNGGGQNWNEWVSSGGMELDGDMATQSMDDSYLSSSNDAWREEQSRSNSGWRPSLENLLTTREHQGLARSGAISSRTGGGGVSGLSQTRPRISSSSVETINAIARRRAQQGRENAYSSFRIPLYAGSSTSLTPAQVEARLETETRARDLLHAGRQRSGRHRHIATPSGVDNNDLSEVGSSIDRPEPDIVGIEFAPASMKHGTDSRLIIGYDKGIMAWNIDGISRHTFPTYELR